MAITEPNLQDLILMSKSVHKLTSNTCFGKTVPKVNWHTNKSLYALPQILTNDANLISFWDEKLIFRFYTRDLYFLKAVFPLCMFFILDAETPLVFMATVTFYCLSQIFTYQHYYYTVSFLEHSTMLLKLESLSDMLLTFKLQFYNAQERNHLSSNDKLYCGMVDWQIALSLIYPPFP